MVENIYHVIIVDKSLSDVTIINRFKKISNHTVDGWVLYKLEIPSGTITEFVKYIQSNMNKGNWYFHAYNEDGSKLNIVFKNKVFQTDNNPKHWDTVISYGISQGTPREQLDFIPNTFTDETY